MKRTIEELAESLVMADPDDLPVLGRIHEMLESVAQWAEQLPDQQVTAAAATSAAELVARVIVNEVEDACMSLQVINDTVSSLQAIINEGRHAGEVGFPAALNLDAATASSSASRDSQPVADPAKIGEHTGQVKLPANVDQQIFDEFLSLQVSVLEQMEKLILSLEHPQHDEGLGELLRLLHTLKGEAGLLGLVEVERLCHACEDALGARDPSAFIDTLLGVKDWLAKTFDAYAGRGDEAGPVEAQLAALVGETPEKGQAEEAPVGSAESETGGVDVKAIVESVPLTGDPELLAEFLTEAVEHLESADCNLLTIETTPEDNDALNAVFRAFHTIKGVAGFLDLKDIQSLAHESESLLDKARMGKLVLTGPALDVTFESVDLMKKLVDFVRDAVNSGGLVARDPAQPQLMKRIAAAKCGDPVAASGHIESKKQENVEATTSGQTAPMSVETTAKTSGSDPTPVRSSDGKDTKASVPQKKATQVKETVKVDATRLDALVDMIGELVIAEAMVSQVSGLEATGSAPAARALRHLDKITRELQGMATSLRMVPIRSTFQRMARLVRDVAKKTNKKVEFTMFGEETELDKTVVDHIGDPLVHMVRNAVDHGIEGCVEDRRRAGKPDAGRVQLRAFHKGGNIIVELEDDGRGLDRNRILQKAKERGLVREGDHLTDTQIYNLVFEPGFSTAKVVSDVSGRGVGMDVVRRNIQALRGQVQINSQPNKGSVFSIQLPLTLAIIEGMIVRVGSCRYILPLLSITHMLRPGEHMIQTAFNTAEMLSLADGLIPMVRLHRLFDVHDAQQDPQQAAVVVIEHKGRRVGLLIDELLGQQQIVLKGLGRVFKGLAGVAGGAIMPDGLVGLIVDLDSLIKIADTQSPAARSAA